MTSLLFSLQRPEVASRFLFVALVMAKCRIQAISRELKTKDWEFSPVLSKLLMAIILQSVPLEAIPTSVFSLLLRQAHVHVKGNRWTVKTMFYLARLIPSCRLVLERLDLPIVKFDEHVRSLLRRWITSCALRLYPRPYDAFPMVDFAHMNEIMSEWQGVTQIISDAVPLTDYLCKAYWLQVCGSFLGQLNCSAIVGYSEIFEGHFVWRDRRRLLTGFLKVSFKINTRSVLTSYNLRGTLPSAAPCALFVVEDNERMLELLSYLSLESAFACTFVDDSVVEFCSKSLLDSTVRARFWHFLSDRQNEFGADFVITCFTSLGPATTLVSCLPGLGRMYTLDYPTNHVMISSRNFLAKMRLISHLSRRMKLRLVDESLGSTELLNSSEINSQEVIHSLESFMHLWIFFNMHYEGAWDVSPMVTSRVANFQVDTALQFLTQRKLLSRHITRYLWRVAFKLISLWAAYVSKFYWEGRLTSFGERVLPLIMHLRRAIRHCRFTDAYDRLDLDATLEDVAKCLIHAKETPEIHSLDELEAALLILTGCRQALGVEEGAMKQPASGIVVLKHLGSGTFGDVFRVYDYGRNQIFALKEIDLRSAAVVRKAVIEEVNYLRLFRYNYITHFHEAKIIDSRLYITTEHCMGQALLRAAPARLFRDSIYANLLFRRITIQLLLGLGFLHSKGVVHGDLKPANILMDSFERIKLVDFGATKALLQKSAVIYGPKGILALGTIEYMAPETLLGSCYTLRADIWSLGCTLFHLVTGKAPWVNCVLPWGVLYNVQAGKLFNMDELERTSLDTDAKTLIKACLHFNPEERPPAFELLMSPFLFGSISCLPLTISPTW